MSTNESAALLGKAAGALFNFGLIVWAASATSGVLSWLLWSYAAIGVLGLALRTSRD